MNAAPPILSGRERRHLPGNFDPRLIREEFPIFGSNPGLVFLDSAASAQKPRAVIDGIADYYRTDYANVHRGVYHLSGRSTDLFEESREKVRAFLNAADQNEIVFVRNTTEAINLVAFAWGGSFVRAGDEVVVSDLEHHSNFVPWQMLCERAGGRLLVAPTDSTGEFDLSALEARLSSHTRLVAVTHISNVTGAMLPVARIVELAHAKGAKVLIDGSQAAPRLPLDVQALGCDFYAFTGHKVYGPTGIGVLYARGEMLAAMPPWQTGGGMIEQVTLAGTAFQAPPHRFEAGTPDIAGAIGLGYAIDFVEALGRANISEHEADLTGYAVDRLSRVPGLRLLGGGQRQLGVISFNLDGVHPHDVGTVLDQHNVAVRVGHHCAQPLMDKLGLAGTVRASFGVYNDERDVDGLVEAVEAAREMFR